MANHIIKMCLESTILNIFKISIVCYIQKWGHIYPCISSSYSRGSHARRTRCSNPFFEHLEHNGAPQTPLARGIISTFVYPISCLHHICLKEISYAWGHDGPQTPFHLIHKSLPKPKRSRYG